MAQRKQASLANSTAHSPLQNHMLAALPAAEFECFNAHLELVPMPLGEFLYEPGLALQHAYFPTTCIMCWSPAQLPKRQA